MNWWLLGLVCPLFILFSIYHVKIVRHIKKKSESERIIVWGGLQEKTPFRVWVVTYILSSIGCISTFVLFVSLNTPDGFSIFLFVSLNVSYIAINYGIIQEKTRLVLFCLWSSMFVYIALFVYTVVAIKTEEDAYNDALLVVVHLCNAVAVIHVAVMDLIIWYRGWAEQLRRDQLVNQFEANDFL